jgi:hypothetical protein
MKTNINQFPKFSVIHNYCKIDCTTDLFSTEEEAMKVYERISRSILNDTNSLEISHWRNNSEGLSVEIRKISAMPSNEITEILNAENEEEQNTAWNEAIMTYSEPVKAKYTFLSDEWSEEENGFIIKETETEHALYSTLPFSKNCVNLETGEEVILKGAIK